VFVNQFDMEASARLLEFFGDSTPWHRSLWGVGSVLAAREVLEAVAQPGVKAAAFSQLCGHALQVIRPDFGLGPEKELVQRVLTKPPQFESIGHLELRALEARFSAAYLKRWSEKLRSAPSHLRVEGTARLLAAHALDMGFSARQCHHMLVAMQRQAHEHCLADFVDELDDRLSRGPGAPFEIFIPITSQPLPVAELPDYWLSAQEARHWLRQHHPNESLRHHGALLLQIPALDPWSAAEKAIERIEVLVARIRLAKRQKALTYHSKIFIKGDPRAFTLAKAPRRVDIGALARTNQLFSLADPENQFIDAALELLSSLDFGLPATATPMAWAALESLLLGPGDEGNHGVAGDRLADIVACSFPRAELTDLSYRCSGELLKGQTANKQRCRAVLNAIREGRDLGVKEDRDRIAVRRMAQVAMNPATYLKGVRGHIQMMILRSYRQRNLVLHAGRVDAVGLRSALRASAPIVGAGMDRVVHAWFVQHVRPLELAVRASHNLELVGSDPRLSPLELLD
jgi:hypothetical protein